MKGKPEEIAISTKIEIQDICGLWEVIRISYENEEIISYPWIKNRFKFEFQPGMKFFCLKDGNTIDGSWELMLRSDDNHRRYSIILNETYEFIILDLSDEEMTLFDRRNKYLLVRKL
jgi:hypothetical protein